MKKTFFVFLSLVFSVLSKSQNIYTNANAGFSINLNSDWVLRPDVSETMALSASNKNKNELITIQLSKVPANTTLAYSREEAELVKPGIIALLTRKGVKIKKISVFPDKLSGQKCLTTIAYISDPALFNGKEHYYKTIQFVHRNYMLVINYSVRLSRLNTMELKFIEKQLQTIKLF